MTLKNALKIFLLVSICLGLSACGNRRSSAGGPEKPPLSDFESNNRDTAADRNTSSSIYDVFGPNKTDQTVNVNRYLWSASLDVLSFLPVTSVDPFTGVIITGYGVPPGGGRSYRATVHINDPALDARSLSVALHTRGGPVSASTTRAVEDAILSRARQIRVRDSRL